MVLLPSLEVEFRQYNERLKKQIALAEKEVRMCDMQATQQGISEVKMLVRDASARKQSSSPSKTPIRMIPYCQNECFFGRRPILDDLSKTLDPARLPKRQRKFALYGLGGCGKTQVALEYVYSHFEEYEVILWISSSSVEKIEKAFVEAALLLGLGEPGLHANEARQYALKRLSETGTWVEVKMLGIDSHARRELLDGFRQRRGSSIDPVILAPYQPWFYPYHQPRHGYVQDQIQTFGCCVRVYNR